MAAVRLGLRGRWRKRRRQVEASPIGPGSGATGAAKQAPESGPGHIPENDRARDPDGRPASLPIGESEHPPRVRLRFFDDYGSGWLWAGDDAALAMFGYGPIEYESFPQLSAETRAMAVALSARSWESLNWDDPAGGLLWTQPELEAFNRQVAILLQRMTTELGPDFDLF